MIGEEGEEEMKFEEVDRAVRKLKKRKAVGEEGIQNELWLWGEEGLRRALGGICSRVWSGGGFRKEGFRNNAEKERSGKGGGA